MKIKNYIFVLNWKANPPSVREAIKLFRGTVPVGNRGTVIVCPPALYLSSVADIKKSLKAKIFLGAQDMSVFPEGAHTGFIPASMIKSAGATHVILGHSERRREGEISQIVNAKIHAALEAKLMPIVCIGEETRDQKGKYVQFLRKQIRETFAGIPEIQFKNLMIAYEPVWAIGADAVRSATVPECEETSILIKRILKEECNVMHEKVITILYGGSVNETNAKEFLDRGRIDGFLIGRASLDPKVLKKIIT